MLIGLCLFVMNFFAFFGQSLYDMVMSKEADLNKESYNRIASAFSGTRSFVWPDLKYLASLVPSGAKVLDVGCGNGRLLDLFVDKNIQYLGVDFSESLIEEARAKYPARSFVVMDARELKKQGDSFDFVFCLSVLNHFPEEEQVEVMDNLRAVMKPGAYLLMINWNLWNIFRKKSVWRRPWSEIWSKAKFGINKNVFTSWQSAKAKASLYYYAFTKKDLRRLCNKLGLQIEKNYYSRAGRRGFWFNGDNLVTVVRRLEVEVKEKKRVSEYLVGEEVLTV